MPKSDTHNAIVLQPPPGTRFSIHLHTIELQFARGREREVYDYLREWLELYVLPEVTSAERGPVDPHPEITALKAKLDADKKVKRNPGITQGEQKMAAIGLNPVPATQNVPQYIPPTPKPFANMPKPGVPVVYGPNGPMTEDEIRTLPDRPGPNGYLSPQMTATPAVSEGTDTVNPDESSGT